MDKQGKLLIIGFGPGAMEHITGRALAAIEESEAVIGYNTYVELIKPLLRHQEIVGTGMTEEISRAQEAVRRAETGQTVAVISSGDAGVYGMAGLVYEVLIERGWNPEKGIQVEVIPGISAIQSCSSLLGAPIMHDACTISLSDHLTPWESIATRVEAAAAADFVIAFYNPRSGRRTRQIEEARNILLRYREPGTPVGIVKSAYRDRQQTVVTTLEDMLEHEIGMLSTVIIGNSATTVFEGIMITPRGYERKYSLGAETQALKPHERLRTSAEPWSLTASEGVTGQRGEAVACHPAAGGATCAKAVQVEGTPQVFPALKQSAAIMAAEGGEAEARIFTAELEVLPPVGSRTLTGAQLALLAEVAGPAGQVTHTREGHFLLRSIACRPQELARKLLGAGMRVMQQGSFVHVETCGFCEGRRAGGLGAAIRLNYLLAGQPVPRELRIQVNGCGMTCNSAVLDDIGVVYSKGSFELYLGGKKSGRSPQAGTLAGQGMNEDEVIEAVMAVVGRYRELATENERFHTFFARVGLAGICLGSDHEAKVTKVETAVRTVLLVGHGSRVAEGNDELRAFANLLARRRPELKFETCFIELAGPSIAKGIENCVQGGATAIYVVPIILFAAGHSKLDIPQAIDQAKARYPGVDFIYGRPIGVQDRAVEILLDRISEAVPVIPSKQPNPQKEVSVEKKVNIPDEETVVLLMGRGGSDPDANSDFCKLSRLLWEQTSYKSVESCFIAIAKPSLAAGLERCLLLGARKIIVLPYLLFTGVLIRQFNERVAAFAAEHPDIEVEIGSYLGAHPLLVEMLEERIDETLNGRSHANCDNCKYRTEAGVHHHHHGHDHHHENGCGHDHSHGHDHHHENGGGHGHNHGHDHHHENGCGHNHSHGHEHHHDEHDHTNGHSQCQGHYDFNHGSVHHRYCQMHSDDRERDHGPEHCNCAGDHQECPKEEQEVSGQLDRIGQPVSGSGTGSR